MSKFGKLKYWKQVPKRNMYHNSQLKCETGKKIAEAIKKKLKVEIIYSAGSTPMASRIIEPFNLFERFGHYYVESYCQLRRELRTFRIDRIISARITDSPQERFLTPNTPTTTAHIYKGIPGWIWIVGILLILYRCIK